MAIVGHWTSLAEAQKLVQSVLLQGIIQEIIEEGQIMPSLPVTGITGKSLKYNRESTLPSAQFYDIHEQIPWSADVSYATQVEVELKRVIFQTILDNFMAKNYKNPNDYESIVMMEAAKGCLRTMEQNLIYANPSTNTKAVESLWSLTPAAQVVENHGSGGALSLAKLREMMDLVRVPGRKILLCSRAVGRRIDAAFQEGDLGKGQLSWAVNQLGQRVTIFNGAEIVRSDYMLQTEGDSSRPTAWGGTGASNSSIFCLTLTPLTSGGLSLVIGADTGGPNFFSVTKISDLEDYDAAGIRLTAYVNLALGSTKAIGKLENITDAAVTV